MDDLLALFLSGGGGGGSVESHAVSYLRQELTENQKLQARENIGAPDESVWDEYLIPIMINEYGATEAMKKYIQSKHSAQLTKAVGRFYEAAAKIETRKFTSQFYKYTTSPSSVGTKLDDNEDMVCTPSTISTPGTDDYAEIPLFACFDVNYTIDADTLEPVIHAIKGISEDFSYAPSESFVGVMQMTGYYRRTTTETTKTVEYQANPAEGFKPLPEAIRASDNSVRPFVIHAKYMAGFNSAGKLSSISGATVATRRIGSAGGRDSLGRFYIIPIIRENGNQYCASSLCDVAFIQLMLEIKYAVLNGKDIMTGCINYNVQVQTAAEETGVKRVILSETDAGNLVVGSSVSVGSGNGRNRAECYDICDITTILSIEDVDIEGVAYKAVYLDAENEFNVPVGAYVSTHPWITGATDDVPGNDGSPYSNTSRKEPYKLQGIELFNGASEMVGDTVSDITETASDIYMTRLAADVNRSDVVPENAVLIGSITKTTTGYKYITELNWEQNDQEKYMIATADGGSQSTGYGAAYTLPSAAEFRDYSVYGSYIHNTLGGIAFYSPHETRNGNSDMGYRLCGTAGNRGHIS